jgi:lipoprotein-releasing system permease protein
MNGFQKEVRDRMLSAISHIEVLGFDGNLAALNDWRATLAAAQKNNAVVGAAPFVGAQALLQRNEVMKGTVVRGIDPALEATVNELGQQTLVGSLDALKSGSYGIALGIDLARSLGVQLGDKVTLLAPNGSNTGPAGVTPRMRAMTVAAIFEAGHAEFDGGLALTHIDDAARIFQVTNANGEQAASGVRLKVENMMAAPSVARELQAQLGTNVAVRDWTRVNSHWFAAVQIEKRMLGLIITLIMAVAAFNLVSTLVMTVTDKRSDIAILRTLGASPRSIMGVFITQGAFVGVVGTLVGVALGCLVAYNVGSIVGFIEQLFKTAFLPKDIYLISRMPSDPRLSDIVPICFISLTLALLATLYPSWRASRVNPAEALRYE